MIFEKEEILEQYLFSKLKSLMYNGEKCYRQCKAGNGVIDILIETPKENIIIELKRDHISSAHIDQVIKYRNFFGWNNSKCILIGSDTSLKTKRIAGSSDISVYLYSVTSTNPLELSFEHVAGEYNPILSRIDKSFIL